MASIGHIAVGMAVARRHRKGQLASGPMITSMFAWSFLSMLPDADVLGFRFGISYSDPWGHRGATHSLAFAIVLGALVGAFAGSAALPRVRTGLYASAVLASHGLLDTMTDGGLGCALLWPFSQHRYFAPWRPIPVAPIGRAFFSASGLHVALVELFLFSPFLVYALWRSHKTLADGST